MNVALKPREQEVVVERDIKASRERVFAAWTDINQASLWWMPKDFTLLSCEMDVRPGGRWRREMRAADGGVFVKHGVYREIRPPERLVFTYLTEDGELANRETVVTVTLAEIPGGTRLTLRQTGLTSDAGLMSHRTGWTGAVDRLETFAAT